MLRMLDDIIRDCFEQKQQKNRQYYLVWLRKLTLYSFNIFKNLYLSWKSIVAVAVVSDHNQNNTPPLKSSKTMPKLLRIAPTSTVFSGSDSADFFQYSDLRRMLAGKKFRENEDGVENTRQ